MAQWIPKTAWKVSNLNKRYGPSYITSEYALDSVVGSTKTVHDVQKMRQMMSGQKGVVVIDVRDSVERKLYPVPGSVAIHHHDLLSGAACPILPQQKERSELFIVASNQQRGFNCSAALRRWGYDNLFLVDYRSLVDSGCIPKPKPSENGE
ncbi:hypothetical protein DQ04_01011030 [Trypanosoma grayi]|uniref:hypothetical protein n=1 Tax=Trypanosoma grayi TaxID=71804 RepID=UPI0004F46C6B|nr:hypothetical protein DQ04_01011030 [Trypanosoma grayi]KEG13420.1 hypothetical protein DQ04_01011030 [Trypanosoma grayi]